MPSLRAVHRTVRNITLTLLLLSTILVSISATQPVHANDVTVSPGKSDLRLGNSTNLVELSYPNSTILTESVGDLLFTVTLETMNGTNNCNLGPPTEPANIADGGCLFSVSIYVPPDFTGLNIGNTWTSFTNDYDSHYIRLSRQSSADEIAPNWWQISLSNLDLTCNPSLADPTITPGHPNPVFLTYPICPSGSPTLIRPNLNTLDFFK